MLAIICQFHIVLKIFISIEVRKVLYIIFESSPER